MAGGSPWQWGLLGGFRSCRAVMEGPPLIFDKRMTEPTVKI